MIRKSIQGRSLPLAMAAVAVAALLAAVPLVAEPHGPAGGPGRGPGSGHADGHGFAGPGHRGPGPAHRGPGHGLFAGRGFERLARFLDLSEEQRTQARAIHQATRDQAQPIFEESRTLRGELQDLLAQEAPDPTAVGETFLALHANRVRIRQLHESARAQFEALLTQDQLDELATFEERRHERRGRRGGPRPGAAS